MMRLVENIRRMPFWATFGLWVCLCAMGTIPDVLVVRYFAGIALVGLGGAFMLRLEELIDD
jgi:hypothetical protein